MTNRFLKLSIHLKIAMDAPTDLPTVHLNVSLTRVTTMNAPTWIMKISVEQSAGRYANK